MNICEAVEHSEALNEDEVGAKVQEDINQALGVVFYVVGDKFREFADNNVILNFSEALLHLKIVAQIAKCIVIGQGVSAAQSVFLQEQLRAVSSLRAVPVLHRLNEKIQKELVDKCDDKNVLITHPTPLHPLQFSSYLIVDEHCTAMADYANCEHIQGILLIEAAKQLFMASVRTQDIAPAFAVKQEEMRFTLSGLQVHFENFVFPLAAQLHLTLSDININGLSASGVASVRVMQFGRLCSEVIFYAKAHTQKIFSSLEKRGAIKAKNRLDFTKAYF